MIRSIRKTNALWAAGVLCVLAGCRHQSSVPPPTQAQAPTVVPASASITVVTPLPSIPPDAKPTNVKPTDAQPAAPPPAVPIPAPVVQKPRKRFHRTRPAVAENSTTPTASAGAGKESSATANLQNASEIKTASTETAATTVGGVSPSPPGTPGPSYNSSAAEEAAPALGQLSTGGAASQPARVRLLAETQSLEARLARVKRTVAGDAASVRMQVQVFLKRAREAVEESDLDGAQTLNTKARVLLGELETQS